MKTPVLYGFLLALVGALLTFGMFFAGLHNSVEKLKLAQVLGGLLGLIASIVCYVLAIRASRASAPADRPWGYGSAVGSGVLTALWGTLFSAVVSFLYFAVINPAFSEMIYQAQVAQAQQRGATDAQIEQGARIMHAFTSPLGMTIMNGIIGFVISVVLVLIIAVFFRNTSAQSTDGTAEAA